MLRAVECMSYVACLSFFTHGPVVRWPLQHGTHGFGRGRPDAVHVLVVFLLSENLGVFCMET